MIASLESESIRGESPTGQPFPAFTQNLVVLVHNMTQMRISMMFRIRSLTIGCMIFAVLAMLSVETGAFAATGSGNETAAGANKEHLRFFETKIRPLLAEHCFKCHGEKNEKGGVRLDSLAAMIQGGESGPAIVPGKPDESLLIEAVRYEGYEMPPSGPLGENQIEALETWVRIGAPWPGVDPKNLQPAAKETGPIFSVEDQNWWAIQTVKNPALPSGPLNHWARNGVDRFIAEGLQSQGLSPSPEADKATLVRRLYFDLTGLPPTPEQMARFVNDPSEDAYEALVDRLLESPEYGERFARHWLDLVRYADSDGYRADHKRPNSWRYRDYVVDSFNSNKPYDQFVKEQIAGDELYPERPEAQIATGFLTHGIYEYNSRDVVGQWDIMINEVTDTIGDVFLGVGMQCSRCHDHKFDPILQRDYFSLRAFIEPIVIETDAICATNQERSEYQESYDQWLSETEAIRKELDALEAPYRKRAKNKAVIKFPQSIQDIMLKDEEERTPREQQYALLAHRQVEFEYDRMDGMFSKEDKDKILALRRKLQEFDKIKPADLAVAQTVRNVDSEAPPTVIPKKRKEVSPAFLSILNERESQGKIDEQQRAPSAIGRRSQLANWISDPNNPLTTRVIVNRVWQWHFGKGLAPNASDFGFLGGPPSHPELLDWLTVQFVSGGWKLKPLHRLIVTSSTYRQSSVHPDSSRLMQIDPQNQWYWRSDVRRLDAEQIRDAILAVSGKLNPKSGGPAASDDRHRRSIYTIVQRNSRNPLLNAFDLPLFFSSTASRDTTTNPLQSLMLINSQEMLDHAKELAWQLRDMPNQKSVERLWQLAFGRTPTDDELLAAIDFVQSQKQNYSGAESATAIETTTLPYRNGSAVVIDPESKVKLRSTASEALQDEEFTIEAIFQLASIYNTGSVRPIASTWSGKKTAAGWTFGVTGKGSRRKPQTLVLHAFGSDGKTNVTEAAVFSDQHVEIGKPYYAAASIEMAADGSPGKVTFYLKDLSDEEQPISVATMDHDLVGGVSGEARLTIGARAAGSSGVFDGLIDDVRFSQGARTLEELLLSNDIADDATLGLWRFEPAAGLEKDASSKQADLMIQSKSASRLSPDQRALADLCHVLLNSSEFLYVR